MTEIFGEHVLVWLGPVPLTRTMLTSALTSGALLALGRAVARAVASRPQTRLAAAGRLAIGFLREAGKGRAALVPRTPRHQARMHSTGTAMGIKTKSVPL